MSIVDSPNRESQSIAELVRILDVASEVRRQRELLDQQWDRDAAKEHLKKRLLATTAVTGEELTEAQIDAAIDWYYDKLHRFKHPAPSLRLVLAHLYVRRWRVFAVLVALAVVVWIAASAFGAAATASARTTDGHSDDSDAITSLRDDIAWIEANASQTVATSLERWQTEIAAGRANEQLRIEVGEMRRTLEQQYGVSVVDWYPERSGSPDRWQPYPSTPALPDGRFITLEIDRPTQRIQITESLPPYRTASVSRWHQAIPSPVHERYASKGEIYYAYKWPGELTWRVELEGVDGQPVADGPRLLCESESTREGRRD